MTVLFLRGPCQMRALAADRVASALAPPLLAVGLPCLWRTNCVNLVFARIMAGFNFCVPDCLVPPLIDAFNEELSAGSGIAYDVPGIGELCARVRARLGEDESLRVARDEYVPQLQEWLSAKI